METTIDLGLGLEEPIEFISFGDQHFKYMAGADLENPEIMYTAKKRKDSVNPIRKHYQAAQAVMEYASMYDYTMFSGDTVDFFSYGSLDIAKDVMFDKSPESLVAVGYHDYVVYTMSGRNSKEFDQRAAKDVLRSYYPNDITYASYDVPNTPIKVVYMDDSRNGQFYWSDGIHEKFAADIEDARANGKYIFVLKHEGTCTNDENQTTSNGFITGDPNDEGSMGYINYGKQMIIDCDFADDNVTDSEDMRFRKHNRFLRSLKEDTLIIIDNFNTVASGDSLFDVVMKYRCKIIFTTRSKFENYTYFDLNEMPIETLVDLAKYFYKGTQNELDTLTQIIEEVHRHTLSVELAARLLASGILEPNRLLQELKDTKSVLHTEDKINIVKDGTSSKATYYEHIHTLVSLFTLSDEAINIMRNMTFIPSDGIKPRMFARWTDLNNLNTVNDLIEYGFIQVNDYRKITLHPLIQEIAIDDTKPSVASCMILIEAVRNECLLHGFDLPYHLLLFKITENVIGIAEHDNIERYKLFLKDVFAYMEKYAYRLGMELVISELQDLIGNSEDKAMLLDYKAAYEHICMKNNKKALQYEIHAVKLCEEITATNPHLAANIYGNIGGLYHADKQFEKAKQYMELAHNTHVDSGMDFTNDGVIQICNYANLAANMGEPLNAIKALKRCADAVKEHNSEYSSDYANLVWDMGCIYLEIGNKINATDCFKSALNIYNIVWENEPELLQAKAEELKKILGMFKFDYLSLTN